MFAHRNDLTDKLRWNLNWRRVGFPLAGLFLGAAVSGLVVLALPKRYVSSAIVRGPELVYAYQDAVPEDWNYLLRHALSREGMVDLTYPSQPTEEQIQAIRQNLTLRHFTLRRNIPALIHCTEIRYESADKGTVRKVLGNVVRAIVDAHLNYVSENANGPECPRPADCHGPVAFEILDIPSEAALKYRSSWIFIGSALGLLAGVLREKR